MFTKKELEELAAEGKTLFVMTYIEGDPVSSCVAVTGSQNEILSHLTVKVARLFFHMKEAAADQGEEFPAEEAIEDFCKALREAYSMIETAEREG